MTSRPRRKFRNARPNADGVTKARAPSLERLKSWAQVGLRTWNRSSEDNIGLIAAGVAFYTFLALVPLIGATVLTYGLIATPQTVIANVQALATVMPTEAAMLVGEQLLGVVETSDGKKGLGLLVAMAIALFGARNAAGSIITALNVAYQEQETRGFVAVNLLAITMTATGIVAVIATMAAVAALGHVERLLPGLPAAAHVMGKILSFAALVAGGAAGAATLYRFAPDHSARWRWITPGTILAAVGWILLTIGFSFYAANFGNYGRTYGSLATVVVLLTWVYLSAYLLLIGAELNCELEQRHRKSDPSHRP